MTSLFLLRTLAALLLTPRLPSAAIHAASVPKGAPALLAGTSGRMLDRWKPNVAAYVADRHFHRSPAHGRDYT